ncbi:MAG TPA: hypothetical protein VH041_10265 [Caldimonas sp.]|jgi:uncharacterized lipoprotein YehR (DUF1307 family)|nr:hypothetical protein [Caldimonas sp.]HEX4234681.1 hypothetical protein [Caldimonas sp.]
MKTLLRSLLVVAALVTSIVAVSLVACGDETGWHTLHGVEPAPAAA